MFFRNALPAGTHAPYRPGQPLGITALLPRFHPSQRPAQFADVLMRRGFASNFDTLRQSRDTLWSPAALRLPPKGDRQSCARYLMVFGRKPRTLSRHDGQQQ